jgi:hypothetical protein
MQIAKAKLKPGQHRAVLSDGGNLYLAQGEGQATGAAMTSNPVKSEQCSHAFQRIADASSFDELRKILFDADAVDVELAIRDALHPASGSRPTSSPA